MKFTLHIESENAEMRKAEHAAEALQKVTQLVRNGHPGGKIRDINGNVVGSWTLKDAESDDDVSRPSLDDLSDEDDANENDDS